MSEVQTRAAEVRDPGLSARRALGLLGLGLLPFALALGSLRGFEAPGGERPVLARPSSAAGSQASLQELLDRRPVSLETLVALKAWAGRGLGDALCMDDDLSDFLRPGFDDVERAHALLDLLDAEAEHFTAEFEIVPDAQGSVQQRPGPIRERIFAPLLSLETLGAPFEALMRRQLEAKRSQGAEPLAELIRRFPRYRLEVVGQGLARFLHPSSPGDVHRAHVVLDYLDEASITLAYAEFEVGPDPAGGDQSPVEPNPFRELPDLLGRIAARHALTASGDEWRLLQRLVVRLHEHAVGIGNEGLVEWRAHLAFAADGPEELVRLSVRLSELGFLPLALQDALKALDPGRLTGLVPRTPGEWLTECLLASLARPLVLSRVEAANAGLSGVLGSIPASEWEQVAESPVLPGSESFEDWLASVDPGECIWVGEIMHRQRELGELLLARARLATGKDRRLALELGKRWGLSPGPRYALLELVVRAGSAEEAFAAARKRVELLESHAEQLPGLSAKMRLQRELSGWPVEHARLDILRADALVDLAQFEAAKEPQRAREHLDAALRLAPTHARGVALRAKLRAR